MRLKRRVPKKGRKNRKTEERQKQETKCCQKEHQRSLSSKNRERWKKKISLRTPSLGPVFFRYTAQRRWNPLRRLKDFTLNPILKPRRVLVCNIWLLPLVLYHAVGNFHGYWVTSHRYPAYIVGFKGEKQSIYERDTVSHHWDCRPLIEEVKQCFARELEDHPMEFKIHHRLHSPWKGFDPCLSFWWDRWEHPATVAKYFTSCITDKGEFSTPKCGNKTETKYLTFTLKKKKTETKYPILWIFILNLNTRMKQIILQFSYCFKIWAWFCLT